MCNTKIPNMLIYLATISSEAFTSAVGRLTQTLRGVGQSRTPNGMTEPMKNVGGIQNIMHQICLWKNGLVYFLQRT